MTLAYYHTHNWKLNKYISEYIMITEEIPIKAFHLREQNVMFSVFSQHKQDKYYYFLPSDQRIM